MKMDFDLSEEQRLLKDSVDGLLKSSYDFEARKKYRAEKGGWSRDVWRKFAEQGLLGLPFSEDDGGFGAGPVETMIVMEALGRNLVIEPYLDTVVIGGGFLRRASSEQRAAHLPAVIDGSKTLAFAQLERNSRYDLGDVTCSARRSGAGFTLSGEKFVVGHGDTADTLIVTARTAGGQRDAKGVGVFLVPADAVGVDIRGYETQDGSRVADIKLNNVEVHADAVIGNADDGLSIVNQVVDDVRIALCAEAIGAMEEALRISVEYIKERKQFGVAIGSFQALQHRAADMFTALETARSMSFLASMAASFADLKERTKTVAASKVQIGRSARFIGQNSVHLHGGIGLTMEYRIGHYFKRLTMIEQQAGDADFHLARVASMGGITM
jgi:pimeloyl-CoA dehydrogenase small subunit